MKIANLTLAQMKTAIIASVKNNYSHNVIFGTYPVYKQLNIIRLGGGDLTTMTTFIDGKRTEIDAVETEINALANMDLLTNFTSGTDAENITYVGSVLTNLTTDDQKLYIACALKLL